MLRSLVHRRLNAEEQQLGASLTYLHLMLETAPWAFVKFALFTPLAQHRRTLPADAYHVARLVATQHQDCGTCVQIVVSQARQDGVAPDVLRAVLDDRLDHLAPDLADVARFARAVAAANDAPALRETLQARYGEEGLVELALGIAAAQVFPLTKRALGYATACSLVEVDLKP